MKKLMDNSDDTGTYYAAVFSFGDVPALILASEGMDLDAATNYLSKCVRDPLGALIYDKTGKSMVNIYSFTDDLARQLCQSFVVKEKSYAFGNSNESLGTSEHDHTYKSYKIYFEHYHIYYVGSPFSLIKNRKIHILFGNPLDKGAIA